MIFHLDTDFILIATILEGQLVAMQFDIKKPLTWTLVTKDALLKKCYLVENCN
jgi:hypothetical protein